MGRILGLILLAIVAALPAPAGAVINRVDMATNLAAKCAEGKRFTPDEYVRAITGLTQETRDMGSVKGASEALIARFFELQNYIHNIQACRLDDQFQRYVDSAKYSCFQLVYSDLGIRNTMVEAAGVGWPVSSEYRRDIYKRMWPAIDPCWKTLTRQCLDMNNRAKVREVAEVLAVVRHAEYPSDRLQPRITACSTTVPRCRRSDNSQACEDYLRDAGDILFFDQDLSGLLPPRAP